MTAWRKPLTRGALLLMESLWVYAVVAFMVALVSDQERPTLLGTALVVVLSFCISRFLQASSLPLGLLRLYGVMLSLLLFYAIVRVDFFGDWRFWDFTFADHIFFDTEATFRDKAAAIVGIPLLWAFWLRGVLRGQEYLGFEAVLANFATGVVVIAIIEMFAGRLDMPPAMTFLPVPYIAVGLLTLGLAHAARGEDEFGRSFAPTWLAAVGGSVLLLSAAALIFIVIDYSAALNAFDNGLETVATLIVQAIIIISLPFFWVAEQIFIGIGYLLEQLYGGTRQQEPQQPQEPDPMQEEQSEPRGLPEWVELTIRVLLTGSIVTLIVAVLALAFTRFRRREPPAEVKESTYQEGRLAADLGDLFGSLLGRFRHRSRRSADLEATRRLYFDLLEAGEKRGVERRPPETPLELAPRLDSALLSETPRSITRLFDDVRYGGLDASPDELQRLRRELEDTRSRG